MSTVAKMFSYILNKRIVRFLERNDILSEEQNGFRMLRSCIDHLYTICTILRNRKTMKLDTYVCFVDFSKAFDSVNHSFLWHKIMVAGISGNMLHTIKSMYSNLKSCIRLNGTLTNWFSTDVGGRQGDNLAPTLFALFINDLVPELNSLNCGITIENDFNLSTLLYADDIIVMSSTSDGLQDQLDVLNGWCTKWCLYVNADKTNIMHVRKASTQRSDVRFMIGDKTELCNEVPLLRIYIIRYNEL